MAILKYATDTEVRGAILRWRGNVTAAADELGIQPKNLRKRLETLGISLSALRSGEGVMGVGRVAPLTPSGSLGSDCPPEGPLAPSSGTGRKSGAGLSRSRSQAATFHAVASAMAERDVVEAPVRAAAGQKKPLRLLPGNQERLRDAKLDLGAKHRVETDESTILNQFFEEAFEPWLRSKLGPAKPAKAKRGEKGGDAE